MLLLACFIEDRTTTDWKTQESKSPVTTDSSSRIPITPKGA